MTNGTGSAGMIAGGTTQGAMLDLIQQGESFIYAAVTREGAIKIGVSRNLRDRKKHLDFGGFDHFIALVPGDMAAEQAIHRALAQHRIYGWREYYYPVPDLLPMLNAMRARMKLCPLRQKDLPRIAQCTFHRRVMEHQEADSRLVRAVMGGM